MRKNIDIIIVGQGLAGSLLAWQLIRLGVSVVVIDNKSPQAASRVAAGIMNPLSGRRLVLSRHIEYLLQTANETYDNLQTEFGLQFFHAKQMLRILQNEHEHELYLQRCAEARYQNFIGDFVDSGEWENLNMPFGGFMQRQTGYVDIAALLFQISQYLASQSNYLTESFHSEKFNFHTANITYQNVNAAKIIFCDGINAQNNALFSWLTFQPVKGDILTLRSSTTLSQHIINNGRWLLPLGDNVYKFGASYDWDTTMLEPGAAARERLCAELNAMVKHTIHYEIIAQQCGIRPTTLDKQPFVGFHPLYPHLGIFNGFGSKGALSIPYYARHFADHIVNQSAIDADVDINRVWPHD